MWNMSVIYVRECKNIHCQCWGFAVPSPFSIPGEMRVQLLNQTLLDLGLYDDGPYEVADQNQLNAKLIPVPYHSYLGRILPLCSLLPVHRRERGERSNSRAQTVPQHGWHGAMSQNMPPSFPADEYWLSSICEWLIRLHLALNGTKITWLPQMTPNESTHHRAPLETVFQLQAGGAQCRGTGRASLVASATAV